MSDYLISEETLNSLANSVRTISGENTEMTPDQMVMTMDNTKSVMDALNEHINNKINPHGVTATQVGADPSGTASSAVSALSRFQSGLGNEYIWEKGKYVAGPDGNSVTESGAYNSNTYTKWKYSSSFLESNGSISLVNPSTGSSSVAIATFASNLVGKYCSYENIANGAIIYVTAASKTDSQTMSVTYQLVESVYTFYGYVNSPDSNAYPLNDGYSYKRIGQVGGKVKTGSYVGTGTYGSSNPNTLTFDFEPKFVFVLAKGGSTIYGSSVGFLWIDGSSVVFNTGNSGYGISTAVNGTTFSWYYNGTSAGYQFNVSGTTYNYLAFC